MATLVRSGYSDFRENWKVRKTCCFCFKLIVLMKEQNFEYFRRIGRVFSTIEKLNQKNGHAGKVRIERFWSKLKSPENMLFLPQTDCFDERTKFWMFQKNSKGIFDIWKTQPKKSTNKMATPWRSGYSDFGHNWKVRKTCSFCLKLIVLMKEQNFWMFQKNSKGIFNMWNTQQKKNNQQNCHAGMVRYSDFGQNWKVGKTSCFCFKLIVLMKEQHFECFRRIGRVFSTFSKNQPIKSSNKMATPVRSGYTDFGQNWKVRKTCCFSFKLIFLMKEQNFECFTRIRRVFSTIEKLNQKMATLVRSG